jgi:hypothetical protein
MSKNLNGGNDGQLYVMPKVSVIIQKGGRVPAGAYSYSYNDFVQPPKTLFNVLTSVFTWIIGFCLAVVIFAIPVAITSVVLVNTMSSQGVVTIRTQDIPSDGTKRYVEQKAPQMITPAER